MILNEKVYLFNPFNLKSVSDDEIKKQLDRFETNYIFEDDTPLEIATNLELTNNARYLIGELKNRLEIRLSTSSKLNDLNEDLMTHQLRKEWSSTKTEKAPNIDYFRAIAKKKYYQDRLNELSIREDFLRCKNTYDVLEERVNILKKKYDAMKMEIGL